MSRLTYKLKYYDVPRLHDLVPQEKLALFLIERVPYLIDLKVLELDFIKSKKRSFGQEFLFSAAFFTTKGNRSLSKSRPLERLSKLMSTIDIIVRVDLNNKIINFYRKDKVQV